MYLELDLKKVSKVCGEKKIEMLPGGDLLGTTGYIRGGCSPIGMKKLFKTFIHETAKSLETLTISAGKIGVQVTLAPHQLSTLVEARYADLAGEA
ncbi:MAG: YbaK/EbsC family protein [Cellulosilyticaceae bacterium]